MSNILTWYSPKAPNKQKQFNYKDGFTYTDNLSEQLDSITIVIPFSEKYDFEPFDKVKVRNNAIDSLGYDMLIDSVNETQVTFDSTPLFDYTITLMSYTKALERIVLPNITITRRATGTQKTLRDVIEELLEDYSPKAFINGQFTQIYRLSTAPYSVLDVECPEMQMSKPTLREAIDQVLSVVNCICKVSSNNEIILVNINQKNNPIVLSDLPEINYQNENQSSSDYASELENTFNNVTPNKGINLKNYTLTTEYIGFRNKGSATMADNTVRLEVSKPIYLIKSIESFSSRATPHTGGGYGAPWFFVKEDITNKVYEKQAFNNLDYTTKSNSLFYSRGSNIIDGFNNEAGFWLLTTTTKERIFAGVSDYLKDIMFKVQYYAMENDVKAKSGKYLPETNENNVIIDNPTSAYVDIKQQGTLFKQKVNRLGNRVKILTGRFQVSTGRTDYIPKLGDYLDDFVVMNRELQYYDDFINVRLTLTENFVNINYFTGINARRRSWQIVGQDEATNKQLLEKWYCEFSYSNKTDLDNNDIQPTVSRKLSETMLNVFNYSLGISNPIVYHSIVKTPHTEQQQGKADYLELEMSSYISGNSLIFSFGFEDNYTAGLSLGGEETGGIKQLYNPYVDDNGENTSYHIMLLDLNYTAGYGYLDLSLLTPGVVLINDFGQETVANEQYKDLQALSAFKPRLYIPDYTQLRNNVVVFEFDYYNHKDNRESIGFNVQFEFCSDTPDIVIGKEFLNRQQMVCLQNHSGDYKIYASPNKYKYGDNNLQEDSTLLKPSSPQDLATLTVTGISQCCSKLDVILQEAPAHQSIAITDNNDNLILAINGTGYAYSVYLNLLKTRDRKHYTDYSMKNWN